MKLEQQVVSLELAKKLKELGVKQESYFFWDTVTDNYNVQPEIKHHRTKPEDKNGEYAPHLGGKESRGKWKTESISAFTVAELGEMLPVRDYLSEGIVKDREDLASWVTFKSDGKWHCHLTWRYSKDKVEAIKAPTEADARAKMLIYLLENKLINI